MQSSNYIDYSDDKLCSIAASGDRIAEEEIVVRYSRLVRICARPLFLAGGDAEDLIQEGMLGLLDAIRCYAQDGQANFKTFAEICIRNRLYSAVRAYNSGKHTPLNRSVPIEEPLLDSRFPLALGQLEQSPEEEYIRREDYAETLNALCRSLSGFESRVLSLYLEGNSYAEIGEMLDKPPKSVDNAVQRIRRKLERQLNSAASANS